MTRMIEDSSNGSQFLKSEILSSNLRLRAVKSGIPLSTVVPWKEPNFYVPKLENYFKGYERIKRR
jgi:hypothetical protein